MTPQEQLPEPAPPAGRSPRRRLTIVVACAVAVAAVGGGVGAYLLLSGGDDKSSLEEVAQNAAEAYGNGDVAALKKVACDPSVVKAEDIAPEQGVKNKIEITGDPKVSGSNAEVPINFTSDFSQAPDRDEYGEPPYQVSVKGTFKFINRADGWCVDLNKPLGPGASTTSG